MDGIIELLIGLPLIAHALGIVGKGIRRRATAADLAAWRYLLLPIGALLTVIGAVQLLS